MYLIFPWLTVSQGGCLYYHSFRLKTLVSSMTALLLKADLLLNMPLDYTHMWPLLITFSPIHFSLGDQQQSLSFPKSILAPYLLFFPLQLEGYQYNIPLLSHTFKSLCPWPYMFEVPANLFLFYHLLPDHSVQPHPPPYLPSNTLTSGRWSTSTLISKLSPTFTRCLLLSFYRCLHS